MTDEIEIKNTDNHTPELRQADNETIIIINNIKRRVQENPIYEETCIAN